MGSKLLTTLLISTGILFFGCHGEKFLRYKYNRSPDKGKPNAGIQYQAFHGKLVDKDIWVWGKKLEKCSEDSIKQLYGEISSRYLPADATKQERIEQLKKEKQFKRNFVKYSKD